MSNTILMTETTEQHVAVNGKDMRLEHQTSGWTIWFFAPRYVYIELDGDDVKQPFASRITTMLTRSTDRIGRRVEVKAVADCSQLAEILARINPLDLSDNCSQTDWGRKTLYQAYFGMTQARVEKQYSFTFKHCPTDAKKAERVAYAEAMAEEKVFPVAREEARSQAFRQIRSLIMRLNSDYQGRLQMCMHEANWDWSSSPAITDLLQQEAGLEARLSVIRSTKQQAMRQFADQWTESALIPEETRNALQLYLKQNGFTQIHFSRH